MTMEREMDWQPIDTAPRDRTAILVYCESESILIVSWNVIYGGFDDGEGRPWGKDNATHWMPLPEPPQ